MNLIEYTDTDMLAMGVADMLAGQLNGWLLTHDFAGFAVPGGTTPGPMFDVLCGARLDWSRVHVLPTDERWVPQDHPRSNARLIRERLITDRAAQARLLPLHAPVDDPENAVEAISANIAAELPLAVLLLGMGTDMHTASLFPGTSDLDRALAANAPPVMVQRPPSVNEVRVTLTAPVLNGAMSKHLLIVGADKRAALDRAMSLPPEEAPINAVLDDMTVHWAE